MAKNPFLDHHFVPCCASSRNLDMAPRANSQALQCPINDKGGSTAFAHSRLNRSSAKLSCLALGRRLTKAQVSISGVLTESCNEQRLLCGFHVYCPTTARFLVLASPANTEAFAKEKEAEARLAERKTLSSFSFRDTIRH